MGNLLQIQRCSVNDHRIEPDETPFPTIQARPWWFKNILCFLFRAVFPVFPRACGVALPHGPAVSHPGTAASRCQVTWSSGSTTRLGHYKIFFIKNHHCTECRNSFDPSTFFFPIGIFLLYIFFKYLSLQTPHAAPLPAIPAPCRTRTE